MSTPLNLAKPGRPVRVGVILMNGVTEILDVAPVDFFTSLTRKTVAELPKSTIPEEQLEQALGAEFYWVNENGGTAKLTGELSIQTTNSFYNCPLDIVLIGAHWMAFTPNEAELNFVRKCYDDCTAFITICWGLRAPMMAGLLQGKTATAPQPLLKLLKETVPDVNRVNQRWDRDGKLWTSGTLLNGLDLYVRLQ